MTPDDTPNWIVKEEPRNTFLLINFIKKLQHVPGLEIRWAVWHLFHQEDYSVNPKHSWIDRTTIMVPSSTCLLPWTSWSSSCEVWARGLCRYGENPLQTQSHCKVEISYLFLEEEELWLRWRESSLWQNKGKQNINIFCPDYGWLERFVMISRWTWRSL
jgi:hypothetical protein